MTGRNAKGRPNVGSSPLQTWESRVRIPPGPPVIIMKMLLTSAGFGSQKIADTFLELIGKPAHTIKVILVPTASRTEEEWKYVNKSKQELIELGITEKNITVLELNHKVSYDEIADFDAVYVCGGNTCYLLHKVRESGFDKIIKKFVNEGKLYFGVSAGSILACPSIEITSDENDIGIKDLTGLNFVDLLIVPHYSEESKPRIEQFKKKSKYQVVPLTDSQAFLVNGKERKLI